MNGKNTGLKVAVIGAGNGGQAFAAHMALKGNEVNLFGLSNEELKPIREKGGIELKRGLQGFGRLSKVTTAIDEAVEDAELIMVVTPSVILHTIATLLNRYLKDGQVVVLNPGRTFGALEFAQVTKNLGCRAKFFLAETFTLLYACSLDGPALVDIFGVKSGVQIAAFPSLYNEKVLDLIHRAGFPQFIPAENVLQTSLNNCSPITHPAPTLLSFSLIQSSDELYYYQDAITPHVATYVEKIDNERVALGKALGINVISAREFYNLIYNVTGRNLYEVFQNVPAYKGTFKPSKDLMTGNNIIDEIPKSLIPLYCLGKALNVPTPTIKTVIDLACQICEVNFWSIGRTLRNVGLEGLTAKEMIEFVNRADLFNLKDLTN
jgi:opine dehydrogenase